MKRLMNPVAPLLSLSLILTAPGLGCYEAAAASFKALRVAPPSSAMSFNPGALGRFPVSYQGAGLTAPGFLTPLPVISALTQPASIPQLSPSAPSALEGAAVPAAIAATVEAGPSWQQRLSALGEEVKGIVSSRDVGDQAAVLRRIFEAGLRLSVAPATPEGAPKAASLGSPRTRRMPEVLEISESRRLDTLEGLYVRTQPQGAVAPRSSPLKNRTAGKISPELDRMLRPENVYDVTVSLIAHPSVTEEDQLVYYLSELEGASYRHDHRSGKISVQGISGRDIRVIAGFPAVSRIAGTSKAPTDAATKGQGDNPE